MNKLANTTQENPTNLTFQIYVIRLVFTLLLELVSSKFELPGIKFMQFFD